MTKNVICKWKCHFGATYMDGMTFIFDFKRDLMMIAYAKCHICYFKDARTSFFFRLLGDVPLLRILRESGMSGMNVKDACDIHPAVAYC